VSRVSIDDDVLGDVSIHRNDIDRASHQLLRSMAEAEANNSFCLTSTEEFEKGGAQLLKRDHESSPFPLIESSRSKI
jgi:hypothetical protein